MLQRLLGTDFFRRRALRRASPGVMQDFLAVPHPTRRTPCQDVRIVALDFETTGLDPKRDSILSVGLIDIADMRIQVNTAWHQVVKVERAIPASSAVVHEITDDQAAAGAALETVLPRVLEQLRGAVMLAHYGRIEQTFLNAACRRLYGAPFVIPTIDTLALAQRLFSLRNHSVQSGDLRLFNLRPRYNLPRYKAHNALSDALCTAELFLALVADMAPRRCRLGDFLV